MKILTFIKTIHADGYNKKIIFHKLPTPPILRHTYSSRNTRLNQRTSTLIKYASPVTVRLLVQPLWYSITQHKYYCPSCLVINRPALSTLIRRRSWAKAWLSQVLLFVFTSPCPKLYPYFNCWILVIVASGRIPLFSSGFLFDHRSKVFFSGSEIIEERIGSK